MALISNGKVVDPKFSTTPLIINGDMSVSQRGTSFSSQSGSAYHLDRFKTLASSLGTFTISQSTTVPTGQGFAKSFKLDCTTADASPSAGDTLQFVQYIEGQNLQSLKKGTSSAEAVTVSFWVRSNKTGTYTLELYDNDNSRQISKTYTISSADTWEKKTVNFAGDTTGALDNDNALSFAVQWWLGAGSNSTSGTLSETWTSVTTANRVSSSQVNIADNTDNEWYITGVQMEIGTFDTNTIPSFPFESAENNLRRCLRYYELLASGNAKILGFGGTYNANAPAYVAYYHSKRATPSLDEVDATNYYRLYASGVEYKYNVSSQFFQATPTQAMIINGNAGTVADDKVGFFDTINAGAYIAFDAEL